ncbi:LicD family protein [Shewanella maritima]|uniref:LicD family protein n=1 Tax=Shewanella maritima TaxID=2520507 RepID=UPI0037350BCC
MSSCAEILPDPTLAVLGDDNNTVSVHSKREVKPWWQIEFPEEVEVEAVEVFNRKDSWGKRLETMILQGFNKQGVRQFQLSRVLKNAKSELLSSELIEPLKKLQSHTHNKKSVVKLVCCLDKYIFEGREDTASQLKQHIYTQFDQLNIDTPDVGVTEQSALHLHHNVADAKHLRVLTFRQRQPRDGGLCFKNGSGATHTLEESHSSSANAAILSAKKELSHLPNAHVFEFESSESISKDFSIWAIDAFSSDLMVIRQIEISADGQHWISVDSSLEMFGSALSLLKLYTLIFNDDWSEPFVYRCGVFLGTYRMHMARSFKKLVGGIDRALLQTFYKGVEDGGSRSHHLPRVRFTRHGLSVPFSEQDSQFLAKRMKEFCEFLEHEFGLQAFPCYGTLLGLYRDKDFLPHDDDIDLAVVVDLPEGVTYREQTEQWVEKLAKKGIKAKPPTPTSLNLHCYFKDCDMDLFFIYPSLNKANSLWTHMQQYQVRHVNKKLIVPLGTSTFLGREFNVPNDIEGFLLDRYGKGWVSPDPFYEL